jgi:hypothetical protein
MGDDQEKRDQAHALDVYGRTTVWREDPDGNAMQITRHEERAVPDAWRHVHWGTQGK